MAYADQHEHEVSLRRLFIPDPINIIAETIIGFFIIVLVSLGNVVGLLTGDATSTNPVTFVKEAVTEVLRQIDSLVFVPTLVTFILWMIVGLGTYLIVFQSIKYFTNLVDAVEADAAYIHPKRYQSTSYWLTTLEKFAFWFMAAVAGLILIIFATTIVMTYALAVLTSTVLNPSSTSLIEIPLCILSTMLFMRLVVFGLCLIIPAFRNWYCD